MSIFAQEKRATQCIRKVGLGLLVFLLVFSNVYANPYDNPYNPIQTVESFTAFEVAEDQAVDFTGDPDAAAKVAQFNFTDISGAAKVAAAQLAVFDIARGIGSMRYGSSNVVTNIEAISMLIRMYGDDQALRQQVIAANPGVSATRLSQAMNDAYLAEAQRLGIVNAQESINYNNAATRENLGVWIVKAANIDAPFKQNALYRASDWESIRIENLGAIEALVDLDIIPLQNGKFNPRGTMNRKEWALVLFNVFEEFTEALGLETHYGLVVGNLTQTDPTGKNQDILVREIDDTIKRIQLTTPIRGKATGLVVYKNQILNQGALAIGDEIRYLVKDGVVRYVEVLPKNQVKSRLLEQLKTTEDLQTHQGVVVSVTPEIVKYNGLNQRNLRVRVENDDDKMVDLVSGRDYNRSLQRDYLLVKDTGFMEPTTLKLGDQLTYYTKDGKVLYATWGKVSIETVSGTLRLISPLQDPPQIAMFDRDNNLRIFPVADGAKISVNFYNATLEDLKPGAPVTMSILNNEIMSIYSDSYQPIPGYIPEDGKIRMATVQTIGASKVVFKGDNTMYEIGPNTAIFKETRLVPFSSLRVGDQVKLYFDNIYSNMPKRVVIAGKEQFITKIVKGTLYSYNPNTLQATLSGRSNLVSTTWVEESQPFTQAYTLADDAIISEGGKEIGLEKLGSTYLKRQAYFVIRDAYGKPEIAQLVFSSGGERTYKEAIKSYSNVIDRMVLKNNRTVMFGPDTLFIQNQRLVDKTALAVNSTVQVIINLQNGLETAKVVRLMTTADSLFDNVYVGSIDEVYSYSLNLTNFSKVNDYVWTKSDQGNQLLEFTDDTRIYNATTEKTISRESFFNEPYSRFENDSTDGKGLPKDSYYGFFVADSSNVLKAMHIRFKELFKNVPIDDALTANTQVSGKMDSLLKGTTFTIGTVGEINEQWKRVGLVDSQNYLNFHSEWVLNPTLTYVELSDALILKNDKVIGFEDIDIDDTLYLVRNDEDAMIVFVGD